MNTEGQRSFHTDEIPGGGDDGVPRTIRASGEAMGFSYSKCKNLIFNALNKMRRPGVSQALRDYMMEVDDDECALIGISQS